MEKPRLELPQRTAVARPLIDGRSVLFLVVALAGFGALAWLQLRNVRLGGHTGGPVSSTSAPGLPAEQLEQLALRLEDKNLSTAAAEAWREYLAAAAPAADKAARVHVRIGRLYQAAGQFEQALGSYYRAEALAGGNAAAAGDDLALRIRDCYERMGRYAELAREVNERTSMQSDGSNISGRQIVAEIGDEKITAAEFDRMLTDEVETMLTSTPGLSAERIESLRKQVYDRYARPDQRSNMLQQIVARRVLAREARKRKLDQDAAYRKRLVEDADNRLAATLTTRVADERATTTDQDIERYYEANKSHYEIPARAELGRIVVASRDAAADLIKQLDGGGDFAALAKEHSTEAAAKEHGGQVDDAMFEMDEEVPGVGKDEKLHAMLWALSAGSHLKEPYPIGDAWHVYKVLKKSEGRTPPLSEVRERVESECRQARRGEVMQQFMHELFKEYRVRLNPAAATSQPATEKP